MPKKSWGIAVACLFVLATALAGCGGSGKETGGQQPGATDAGKTQASEKPAQKTTIRFTTWYGPGDIEIWKEVIRNFESENPGVTVQFEPLEWDTFWQKLQTQLAGGTAPDVTGMHVGIIIDYVKKGQLEPLDDYIRSSGRDLKDVPDGLLAEGLWPKDQPKQYALPWRFGSSSVLYGNMTAFREAGIPYPENGWTVDEFLEAAKKLTNSKRYGFLVPKFTQNAALVTAFGTSPLTDDRMHSNYNDPKMIAYKTWQHDLIYKYKVAPNPKELDQNVNPFIAGKVAMAYEGSWMIPTYRDIQDFDWDILPQPSKDGRSALGVGPDMISITKESKNKEAAWKFVDYVVFSAKAQQLLSQTGFPISKKALLDEKTIADVAAKKPAHYKLLMEDAVNRGTSYAFTNIFFELIKLEADADVLIMQNANADIPKIMEDLHKKVTEEFEKRK